MDRINKCIENCQIKVIKSAQKDIEYADSLPTAQGPGERYAIGISEKCLIVIAGLKTDRSFWSLVNYPHTPVFPDYMFS